MCSAEIITGKEIEFEFLKRVKLVRDSLAKDSPLKAAISNELLADALDFINRSTAEELSIAKWPPVYSFSASHAERKILSLDSDLRFVYSNTKPDQLANLVGFLNFKRGEPPGKWSGGLFEVWAKATLLQKQFDTVLDPLLPNGKRPDANIRMGKKRINMEFTAITEDDESRQVWDRYLLARVTDPSIGSLMRPGKFCPQNSKGPSPYYDLRRIYAKVYDKIAKELNPDDHQCADKEPNVLLLSFAPPESATNPAIGWAFDELFGTQPSSAKPPDHITDYTLSGWVDYTGNTYVSQGKMTSKFFAEIGIQFFVPQGNLVPSYYLTVQN